MEKYKICPLCNTKNDPNSIRCDNCDGDITSVNITDDAIEQAKRNEAEAQKQNSSENQTEQKEFVKKCSCGNINPAAARKCTKCGEELSDVIAAPKGCDKYVLEFSDGSQYPLTKESAVIGRENELSDILGQIMTVSRRHCEITECDGKLFIRDLGSLNGTAVNGRKITEKTEICDGSEIVLADNNAGKPVFRFVVRKQ